MLQRLINFGSLFFLMLITGVFWGTWFTLTRSISSFTAGEFIHIGKVIISNVSFPMRLILPLGIIFTTFSLWLSDNKKSVGFLFGILAIILVITVLLITLLVLVPIDNKIASWTVETVPANWESIRDKWEIYHAARTFASLAGFGSFTIYLVSRNI